MDDTYNDRFYDRLFSDLEKVKNNNFDEIEIEKPEIILKKKEQVLPWVEKYRPKKLDDVVEQIEIIKLLNKTLETGDFPHYLFYGPPGTGKTSTVLALVRQLYGPKILHDRVLELNASDERGIDGVRNNIIKFARLSVGTSDPKYKCPDFKIIILDEVDAMTSDAQSALRKVMEETSEITRFVFICNYITKMIDPIKSRCMQIFFKPINNKSIGLKLKSISKNENVILSDKCINTIVDLSEGDLRKAIMILQNSKYLLKYKNIVSSKDIIKMTGNIYEKDFDDFWNNCITFSISKLKQLVNKIIFNGYPVKNMLYFIQKTVFLTDISDKKKSLILLEIANIDKKLSENCDEYLQLLHIVVYINKIVNE
jgi:replication factor C subunit 2/4